MSPDLSVLPFSLPAMPQRAALVFSWRDAAQMPETPPAGVVWVPPPTDEAATQGDDAISFEQRSLTAIGPDGLASLRLLALHRATQDRREEAVGLFLSVLDLMSNSPAREMVRLEYAQTLAAFGRHEDALVAFERVTAHGADSPDDAYAVLACLAAAGAALSWVAEGRADAALDVLDNWPCAADRAAVLSLPACQRTHGLARARTALALHRPMEALSALDPVFRIASDDRDALLTLASILLNLQRPMQAIGPIERVLAQRETDASALVLFGQALSSLGEFAYAVDRFEFALQCAPDFAPAYRYMASALTMQKLDDEALACLRAARKLQPDWPQAWLDEAGIRLRRGQWGRGFEAYEWRDGPRLTARRTDAFWNGDDAIDDRSLLVLAEQGLGDTLHFIRYMPMVARLAREVTVEVQAPLWRLIHHQAAAWGVRVIARGEPQPTCDRFTLLMSLPHALRTRHDTIPATVPYLLPLREHGHAVHAADAVRPLRVGIVPAGNPEYANDAMRSMPLSTLAPLLSLLSRERVDTMLLQPLPRETDLAWMSDHAGLISWEPLAGDFADTAAHVSAFDLVITVDTAMAHLCGAMGQPVWILLPYVPDWRWMEDRSDSPWYPSATLFRQPATHDWASVVRSLCDAFEAWRHPRPCPSKAADTKPETL